LWQKVKFVEIWACLGIRPTLLPTVGLLALSPPPLTRPRGPGRPRANHLLWRDRSLAAVEVASYPSTSPAVRRRVYIS
jgi:hypothetical protein